MKIKISDAAVLAAINVPAEPNAELANFESWAVKATRDQLAAAWPVMLADAIEELQIDVVLDHGRNLVNEARALLRDQIDPSGLSPADIALSLDHELHELGIVSGGQECAITWASIDDTGTAVNLTVEDDEGRDHQFVLRVERRS